jgi:hypothetical protein
MGKEREFKRIIDEAIEAAEAVDCEVGEFKQGLAHMWHALNERCEAEEIDPVQMAKDGELGDGD